MAIFIVFIKETEDLTTVSDVNMKLNNHMLICLTSSREWDSCANSELLIYRCCSSTD